MAMNCWLVIFCLLTTSYAAFSQEDTVLPMTASIANNSAPESKATFPMQGLIPNLDDSTVPASQQNATYNFGRSNGITASSAEIDNRRRLLQKLNHKSASISDSLIAQMIITEKVVAENCAVKPTNNELNDAYRDFVRDLGNDASVSYAEALPLIEKQLIVSKRENCIKLQDNIRRYNDQQQKTSGSRSANASTLSGAAAPRAEAPSPIMRKTSDVQLVADGSDCLAYNLETGSCEVTVDEFNRHALTMSFPVNKPLDSARMVILDKALNVVYYSKKAEESGFVSDPGMRQAVATRMRIMSPSQGGGDAISDSMLKNLYAKYYDAMFAEREKIEIDVLGSTDSLFIDSLALLLSSPESNETGQSKKTSRNGRIYNSTMPWTRLLRDELPTELALATDSLASGECTRRVSTPYGHFILRVAQITVIEKVSFEKAREKLFSMACSGKLPGARNVSEKDARAFYATHSSRFRTPDTVSLRAWLLPDHRTSGNHGFNASTIDSTLRKDTSGVRSMKLRSIDLPELVQNMLASQQDSAAKGSYVGPISTPFGKWYFQVLATIPGGKQETFAQVKTKIMRELASIPAAFADIPMTEREKFLSKDMVAHATWVGAIKNVPEPSNEEVAKALKNGSLIIPENMLTDSNENLMLIAKEIYKGLIVRSAQDAWKKNIGINYRLLLE